MTDKYGQPFQVGDMLVNIRTSNSYMGLVTETFEAEKSVKLFRPITTATRGGNGTPAAVLASLKFSTKTTTDHADDVVKLYEPERWYGQLRPSWRFYGLSDADIEVIHIRVRQIYEWRLRLLHNPPNVKKIKFPEEFKTLV